jgi:hypothetical protein
VCCVWAEQVHLLILAQCESFIFKFLLFAPAFYVCAVPRGVGGCECVMFVIIVLLGSVFFACVSLLMAEECGRRRMFVMSLPW